MVEINGVLETWLSVNRSLKLPSVCPGLDTMAKQTPSHPEQVCLPTPSTIIDTYTRNCHVPVCIGFILAHGTALQCKLGTGEVDRQLPQHGKDPAVGCALFCNLAAQARSFVQLQHACHHLA